MDLSRGVVAAVAAVLVVEVLAVLREGIDATADVYLHPVTMRWLGGDRVTCASKLHQHVLGPEIILVRGCENVAGKLRQKW